MSNYKVIARKYRPQTFKDVLGQDAIVITLKNAIKRHQLAHAYLFCGSRGTGKTTLARIFAKALNCLQPTPEGEPCNTCSSCNEITAGSSLDVLEIDGASHRGIDDIRQINDTVSYATASGKYKIYIIDEVHMLTKEAFNALLKTLEEPPPKVLFFFATTEPHKVLPTILSRCQRFNLNRIPPQEIIKKLRLIATDLQLTVDDDAIRLLANRADGGLRDAESLFDQIIAFNDKDITVQSVTSILGMMPRECFFEFDKSGKEGNLSAAFTIVEQLFSQGKDVGYFLESLLEHFRTILLLKLAGNSAPFLLLSATEQSLYERSAKIYHQEQCLSIIEWIIEAQNQRTTGSGRVQLEALLLRILRSHQRIPIDFLVRRLTELEQAISGNQRIETKEMPLPQPKQQSISIQEDPTPSQNDLNMKIEAIALPTTSSQGPVELGARPTEETKQAKAIEQSRIDTLLQFASVELEGRIRMR